MINHSYFPAIELEKYFLCRILSLWGDVPKEPSTHLMIRFCHWTSFGKHGLWIGFRSILQEAQTAEADGKAKFPALIFGMHSSDSMPANNDAALLDWPGVRYLRYDVNDVGLHAAIKDVLENYDQPLPSHLQLKQSPQSFLQLLRHVKHLFEGVRLSINVRLSRLHRIKNGESLSLSPDRASWVLTNEQESDLKRLAHYMTLSLTLAPKNSGLKPFFKSLQIFRIQYKKISDITQLLPNGGVAAIQDELNSWHEVRSTCEKLIQSLQLLEKGLARTVTGDKCNDP